MKHLTRKEVRKKCRKLPDPIKLYINYTNRKQFYKQSAGRKCHLWWCNAFVNCSTVKVDKCVVSKPALINENKTLCSLKYFLSISNALFANFFLHFAHFFAFYRLSVLVIDIFINFFDLFRHELQNAKKWAWKMENVLFTTIQDHFHR